MDWRPLRWDIKNITEKAIDEGGSNPEDLVEAGAEAMLEALRECQRTEGFERMTEIILKMGEIPKNETASKKSFYY